MDLKKFKNLDWWLICSVLALCIFGIICIGSATHINLGESRSTYYSQMVWVVIGLCIMFAAAYVNLDFFSGFRIMVTRGEVYAEIGFYS